MKGDQGMIGRKEVCVKRKEERQRNVLFDGGGIILKKKRMGWGKN